MLLAIPTALSDLRPSLANLASFIQSTYLIDSIYYSLRGIVLSPEYALLLTELCNSGIKPTFSGSYY